MASIKENTIKRKPSEGTEESNKPQRPSRPGGRSARVRELVLQTTLELLVSEGLGALSIELIAQRSGVHKTTLYRRWGDCGNLIKDAIGQLENAQAPIPNTGSLRGDLEMLARTYADHMAQPQSVAIARLIAAQQGTDSQFGQWIKEYWQSRTDMYREILSRAVDRDELRHSGEITITIELLIAPILMRVLFINQVVDDSFIQQLSDSVYYQLLRTSGLP